MKSRADCGRLDLLLIAPARAAMKSGGTAQAGQRSQCLTMPETWPKERFARFSVKRELMWMNSYARNDVPFAWVHLYSIATFSRCTI
jgi:hypothetical protein